MINYSIIIPHKNIPHLLCRCLASIPRRDDVQIIVVDDNSEADKVDFASFPGLDDPYVEVVFGKNEKGRKGAGYARNLGMERAKGKWLIFADADDFFNPCFAEALDLYKDDPHDIIFFKATGADSETLTVSMRAEPRNDFVEKAIKEQNTDYLRYRLYAPWGKFVKRNLVVANDIQFQEVSHSNDVLFSVFTGAKAKSILASDLSIYCLTSRNNSLEGCKDVDSIYLRLKVAAKAYSFLKKINKEMYAYSDLSYYRSLLDALSRKKARRLIPYLMRHCGIMFVLKPYYSLIINRINQSSKNSIK